MGKAKEHVRVGDPEEDLVVAPPSHPQGGTAYLSIERKAAWEPLDSEQKWSGDSELGRGVLGAQSRGPKCSCVRSMLGPPGPSHIGEPPTGVSGAA